MDLFTLIQMLTQFFIVSPADGKGLHVLPHAMFSTE